MKKVTICIGVFMVLFFVGCVCTAQAVVADGLNGTWLKFTGSLKGMEFVSGPGAEETGRNDSNSIRLYGCVVDGPFYDNQFFVQLYERERTASPAGMAVFQKSAGTANEFAGWFTMNLMDEYNPANPDTISAPGQMTIKRNSLGNIRNIKFKGFGGQAKKEPTVLLGAYTGYALYGVNKLNAKAATAKSLPFGEDTECPAGYVIQVKKTDDGVHSGIVKPAGPWVPVAAGADQAFTITTTVNGTAIYISIDGTPVYEDASAQPAGLTYTYTIPVVSANHSIKVEFK